MKIIICIVNLILATTFLLSSAAAQNQIAELVVQTRHTSWVFAVVFSPDGKLMATGSRDSTVKLWNPATGELLKTFSGHQNSVYSLAFTADGKRLASLSYDKTIKVWDVERGQLVKSFAGHELNIYTGSIAFNRAGKLLERGAAGKSVKVWDAETGREIYSLNDFQSEIKTAAFSPDEKTVFVTIIPKRDEHIISLYNLETHGQLKSFQEHSENDVYALFSPDGKQLAVNKSEIRILDLLTGNFVKEFKGGGYDAKAMAFSQDGKRIAGINFNDEIVIWDLVTGGKVDTQKIYKDEIQALAFTPDDKSLAAVASVPVPILINSATGRFERYFGGFVREIGQTQFSSDGKFLASVGGEDERTIKLWSISEGQTLKTLEATTEVDLGRWSDEKWAVNGDNSTAAYSALYTSGMNMMGGRGSENGVRTIRFSRDGKFLVSAGNDYFIRFWDVETGTLAKSFAGHDYKTDDLAYFEIQGSAPFISKINFSADCKKLVSLSEEGKLRVWSVENEKLLVTINIEEWWFDEHAEENKGYIVFPTAEIAFNRAGDETAILGENGTVRIYRVGDGNEIKKTSFAEFAKSADAEDFPDLIAAAAKTVFNHDGKLKVEYADNGLVNLVDAKTGALTLTLAIFNENDWLVFTPDGLFDGTPAAWENLRWRFNTAALDYVPLEAFFGDSYTPGLLKEIVDGKRPQNVRNFNAVDRRLPSVELKLNDAAVNPDSIKTRQIEIKIETAEAALNSGVRDVRLFRDGSLVKIWRGDVFDKTKDCETIAAPDKPRRAVCRATISIIGGKNQLTAYAFNRDNIKSLKNKLEITGADSLKRDGTLYLLSVGVNDYLNTLYNLNYAVPDATGIAAALAPQQETVKKYAATIIVSLIDKNATRENILLALRRLADSESGLPADLSAEVRAEIGKIKRLQPEDALLIYFAGHGTARCETNAAGNFDCDRFYLVPHDGFPTNEQREAAKTDAEARRMLYAQSISDEDLERELERIDAGKVLMVIDACNSGQALEAEEKRRGPMNSRGLAQLAYEKGMYILTAAQSRQAALEVSKLKHGLLTFTLIEGLKKGDRDHNRSVTEREWFDYAVEQVPRLQMNAMRTRHAEIEKSKRGIELAVAAQDDKNTPLDKRALQTPRVFLPQNQEVQPFVLISSQLEAAKQAARWSELFRRRDYQTVVTETTAELERNPQDAIALRMRAAVYNVQEKIKPKEQDLGRLQRIMRSPIFSAEEYEARCWMLSAAEKYSVALDDCTQAIKLNSQMVLAYRTRAGVYSGLGENDKAIADYDKTIELDPLYSGAFFNRGVRHQKLKNYQAAISDLNRAIELAPGDSDYFVQRGSFYEEREDSISALADYNHALKLNAKNRNAYINRGNLSFKAKKYDAAIADYTKAVEIKEEATSFTNRAAAYEFRGDFTQAIADFNKALELDAKYVRARYRRGLLHLKMKNYDSAIADFTSLIEVSPQTAVLYEQRALAYEGKGDKTAAEADNKTVGELKAQPK